ncbi:hypothetical protein [Phenylobacterium sp.]|uniref:hypothetical protein n=1 Tax=Phenylobacterium sp. TaxID=1871053 RepID=UPI0035B16913
MSVLPIDLGPITERRFSEAFAETATVPACRAASLIGVDEKTLAGLTADKVIRSVPRGKRRGYTERDLRAYLTDQHEAPCPSTSPKTAASGSSTSSLKVAGFMARRGKLRDAPPKRRKSASGVRSAKAALGLPRT